MTQRTFGHWLWLAPLVYVGITSAGAKAFHLHNNNNKDNNNTKNNNNNNTWQWTWKGDLKVETEALNFATQEQVLKTNYVQFNIENSVESPLSRLCRRGGG